MTVIESDPQRRVLGNLPRYRTKTDRATAEKHMREENRYPDTWTLDADIALPDLVRLLDDDKHVETPEDVGAVLNRLQELGLVENTEADRWAMTSDGFEALTGTAANAAAETPESLAAGEAAIAQLRADEQARIDATTTGSGD